MVVDFSFKKVPACRVATVKWKGPWKDSKIRSEFERVDRWAREKGLKTGRWVFVEPGSQRFQVAIEVKGKARGAAGVRVTTLPASRVASITFNPDEVSPRVAYHGMNDWLKWRRKDGDIKRAGTFREVYTGNPWTNKKAWAGTEIQVTVR